MEIFKFHGIQPKYGKIFIPNKNQKKLRQPDSDWSNQILKPLSILWITQENASWSWVQEIPKSQKKWPHSSIRMFLPITHQMIKLNFWKLFRKIGQFSPKTKHLKKPSSLLAESKCRLYFSSATEISQVLLLEIIMIELKRNDFKYLKLAHFCNFWKWRQIILTNKINR